MATTRIGDGLEQMEGDASDGLVSVAQVGGATVAVLDSVTEAFLVLCGGVVVGSHLSARCRVLVVLDGAILPDVGIIQRGERTIEQAGEIRAIVLIIEIGRRSVEAVGIAMILLSATEEVLSIGVVESGIGAGVVGNLLLTADVVGMGPADTEGTDAVVIAIVGALQRQFGSFCCLR